MFGKQSYSETAGQVNFHVEAPPRSHATRHLHVHQIHVFHFLLDSFIFSNRKCVNCALILYGRIDFNKVI